MRHRVDPFLTSMGSGDECQDEDSSSPIRGVQEIVGSIILRKRKKRPLDHLKRFLGRIGIIITVRIELPKEIILLWAGR
ncbi:hypothetical protein H5410_006897 [Solanum commersonii]|uniref:Uncharacterized protein n=1 Tax=Solanum commersonii TaxID=4109 RepID=A0A9J6ACM3_SOLCO|nr:hypothetical protein H5410_006897 [Solanum commersonii]